MKLRMAFAGFRHGHIMDLHRLAARHADLTVVAACEEHAPTREQLAKAGVVKLTHDSCQRMYEQVEFDILAVGDAFGRRGELAIQALSAGRHVIVDKPLCTRLSELEQIERLAGANRLSVGCMLNMRDGGNVLALRQAILAGRIGPVQTLTFSGQHPLLWGTRPDWYFEPGIHGGTINDIAIHAIDAIPFVTGRRLVEAVAARAWNARLPQAPDFQDAAQMMLRMDNNGGVLGDVSYLATGYKDPQYWRLTLHGPDGVAETSAVADGVTLWRPGQPKPERIEPARPREGGYLEDFLAEVLARPAGEAALTTATVLDASRRTLWIQKAADEGLVRVNLDRA